MTCKLNGFYNVFNHISYIAYYSPPCGGGAGGGALCFIYKLQSILLPSLRGWGWGWGFVGDVMGFVGLWLCFSYYLAITLIVTFGRPGSFVIISTRGCERADLISRCSAVIFIFADSPGCNFCLFSETCKPTVNI